MLSVGRWTTISESSFPWERDALDFLRQKLPDQEPYRAWANFEFIAEDEFVEVTPKSLRLRKKVLQANRRRKSTMAVLEEKA